MSSLWGDLSMVAAVVVGVGLVVSGLMVRLRESDRRGVLEYIFTGLILFLPWLVLLVAGLYMSSVH